MASLTVSSSRVLSAAFRSAGRALRSPISARARAAWMRTMADLSFEMARGRGGGRVGEREAARGGARSPPHRFGLVRGQLLYLGGGVVEEELGRVPGELLLESLGLDGLDALIARQFPFGGEGVAPHLDGP